MSPSRQSARTVSDSMRTPVLSLGATSSSITRMIEGTPAITTAPCGPPRPANDSLVRRLQEALHVLFEQQSVLYELLGGFFDRCRAISGIRIALRQRQPWIVILNALLARFSERQHRADVAAQCAFCESD